MFLYSISAGAGLIIFPVILLDSCIFGPRLTVRGVNAFIVDGRDPKSLSFWIPSFGKEEKIDLSLPGTRKGAPQLIFD